MQFPALLDGILGMHLNTEPMNEFNWFKRILCYLTVVASVKFLHKRPEEQITYNDMMRMSGKRNFRFPFMKECSVESGDHREIQGDKSKRCNINKNIKNEHCIHFVCCNIQRWHQISLFRIV